MTTIERLSGGPRPRYRSAVQTVVTDRRPFIICWAVWWGTGGFAGWTGVRTPYAASSTSTRRRDDDDSFLCALSEVDEVFLLMEWSLHRAWWTPFSRVHVLSAVGGSSGVGW